MWCTSSSWIQAYAGRCPPTKNNLCLSHTNAYVYQITFCIKTQDAIFMLIFIYITRDELCWLAITVDNIWKLSHSITHVNISTVHPILVRDASSLEYTKLIAYCVAAQRDVLSRMSAGSTHSSMSKTKSGTYCIGYYIHRQQYFSCCFFGGGVVFYFFIFLCVTKAWNLFLV